MDVNTVANAVYAHNYKTTNVKTRNIQSISEKEVRKLNANMLLMSPPCQPHTRQGLQRDTEDKRSCALTHLCELIPQCETLKYVLMENVKGFETSQARKQFIEALENANFNWREFILTPTQFNVPNTRHRYYCIARRDKDFDFEAGKIWDHMPGVSSSCALETMCTISSIVEPNVPSEARVPDDVLTKRVLVMDIVHPEQSKSMCFTKGYTHYTEGTGSAFSPLTFLGGPIDDLFMNSEEAKRRRELQVARNGMRYMSAETTCQPIWPIESLRNPLPIRRDPVRPISGLGQQSLREELPQAPNYSPWRRRSDPVIPLTTLSQQLDYSPLSLRRDPMWPNCSLAQQLESPQPRRFICETEANEPPSQHCDPPIYPQSGLD
ncbi:Mt2 [Drosophila busckii]|nr:Mt2 [Drosophila busckii]